MATSLSAALPVFITSHANALPFGSTELRLSSAAPASVEAGTGTTSFSVKEVVGLGGNGWTNAATWYNAGVTITASVANGQVATSCNPGAVWGTTATATIPASSDPVESSFCYKSSTVGTHDITLTANGQVSYIFAPHTINDTLTQPVTVVDTTVPSVPTGGAPAGSIYKNSNVFNYTWDPSTDNSDGPITYEYQASNTSGNFDPTTGALTNVSWNSAANGSAAQKAALAAGPSIPSVGTSDGTWYWQVRAIDASGNASNWSQVWSYTLDSQAPMLNVTAPSNGAYEKGSFTVSATASDSDGLNAYYVAVDGVGKGYAYHPANGAMPDVNIDTTTLSEGQHTLLVRVTDFAGNPAQVQQTFTVDRTAPVVNPITVTTADGTTKNAQGAHLAGTVTFHVTQTEANPNRMYVEYDQLGSDGKWHKVASTGDWQYNTNNVDLPINTKNWSDGTYQVKVSTDDQAWNHGGAAATFTVDNTAPVVESVSLNKIVTIGGVHYTSATFNGGKLDVTFTTNEPLRLVGSEIGFYVPGMAGPPSTGWTKVELVNAATNEYVAHIDLTNRTDTSNPNYTSDFFKGKTISGISLYFRVVDALGNTDANYYLASGSFGKSNTNAYKFTIDNAAPTVTITSPTQPYVSNRGSFTITGTADDGANGSSVEGQTMTVGLSDYSTNPKDMGFFYEHVTVQNGKWSATVPANTLAGRNGHQIVISAATRDKVGIAGSAHSNFIADNVQPSLTISSPASDWLAFNSSASPLTVMGTASDALSGLASNLAVSLGTYSATASNHWGTWVAGCSNLTLSGTDFTCSLKLNSGYAPHAVLPDGKYTLRATVQDNAGNWQTFNRYITVDNTPPLHPTNLEVNGQSGTFYTTVGAPFTQTWKDKSKDVVSYNYVSCYVNTMPASNNCSGTTYKTTTTSASKQVNSGDTKHDEVFFWQVQAVDAAGNTSGWSNWSKVVVDSTAPTIENLSLDRTPTNDNSVTVSGTISDTNLASYTYQIVDSSKKNVLGEYSWSKVGGTSSVTNGTLFTADITGLKLDGTHVAPLPDGNYFVRVWATDNSGNKTGIASHIYLPFTVDRTAPTVTIKNYGWTNNVLQPTISVDGDTAPATGYTYSWAPTDPNVDISATNALNPTFTVNKDGTYTFNLTVTDDAGNTTTVPLSFTYTTPTPPANPGVVNGFSTVATTTSTGSGTPAATPLSDNGTGTTTPQVKGDSTSKPKVAGDSTVKLENAANTKSSNFLGLGWWWLLILAVIAAIFWFLAGRRSNEDENEEA